jgi:hypothetical protein
VAFIRLKWFAMTLRLAVLAMGTLLLCIAQVHRKLTPFPAFVQDVKHARAKDFLDRPEARVRDAAAFEQMRNYILKLYDGVHARHSYTVGTQTVDCVPEGEQPSVRAQGIKQIAAPPANAPNSPESAKPHNVLVGECPAGTIPMRRITLLELTRFRTLEDFLHKAPYFK